MTPKLFKDLYKLKKPSSQMYASCINGHKNHSKITTYVGLNGGYRGIHDAPPIPTHLSSPMELEVYDWRSYFNVENDTISNKYKEYCPGQDIISYSIDAQGVWEAYETLLVLDIIKQNKTEDLVLDFGSHIGWYTTMAAINGYSVSAFDANAENLEMVVHNAELNRASDKVFSYLSWLDNDVPVLPSNAESVHLLKADVEGAENHVLTMTRELFKAGKINYALIEVSPVFDGYYPDLVEEIASYGYDVYQIPGKGWEHSEEYGKAPLTTLKKHCKLESENRRQYVSSLHQENFLFVKEDLYV